MLDAGLSGTAESVNGCDGQARDRGVLEGRRAEHARETTAAGDAVAWPRSNDTGREVDTKQQEITERTPT